MVKETFPTSICNFVKWYNEEVKHIIIADE